LSSKKEKFGSVSKVTIKMESSELDKLRLLARHRKRSLSEVVRDCISDYVSRPENNLDFYVYNCPYGCGFSVETTNMPEEEQKSLVKMHEKNCPKRKKK